MSIDDYLSIQMLQSRLTVYTDSMEAHRIAEELFADSPDAELDLGERGTARGYEAVCRYYADLDERIKKNGNTLGSDLAASQQIRIEEDGEYAGVLFWNSNPMI